MNSITDIEARHLPKNKHECIRLIKLLVLRPSCSSSCSEHKNKGKVAKLHGSPATPTRECHGTWSVNRSKYHYPMLNCPENR